jgi:hypothetical protein
MRAVACGAPAVMDPVSGVMIRELQRATAVQRAALGASGLTVICTGDPSMLAPPCGAVMSSEHTPDSALQYDSVSTLLFAGRFHHTRSLPLGTCTHAWRRC